MNDVRFVPPLVVGNAVPDKLIANVPLVVMGEPAMDKNDGTLAATLVTVPPPSATHSRAVAPEFSLRPLLPLPV